MASLRLSALALALALLVSCSESQSLRNLKKDSGDAAASSEGLIETRPCLQIWSPEVKNVILTHTTDPALKLQHDPACEIEGACASGCCRVHTSLMVCDPANDYLILQCVCNANTSNPPLPPPLAPTPAPIAEIDREVKFDACMSDSMNPFGGLSNLGPACKVAGDCDGNGNTALSEGACCVAGWCTCKVPDLTSFVNPEECVPRTQIPDLPTLLPSLP